MFHVKHFKTGCYQQLLTSYQPVINNFINMRKIYESIVNYKFTILTMVIIVFLSLSGSNNINTPRFLDFKGADKLIHFGMYGFLTLIYLMERTGLLKPKMKTKQTRWFFVIWIVLIGAIIEIVQPIFAGREKDILDFFSNTAGVIMAYIAFYVFTRYYNFNSISSS